MFIKIKNTRINFDCVQSYYPSYSESTQKYHLNICYSNSVDDDDIIVFQTEEEIKTVIQTLDFLTKTFDIETEL